MEQEKNAQAAPDKGQAPASPVDNLPPELRAEAADLLAAAEEGAPGAPAGAGAEEPAMATGDALALLLRPGFAILAPAWGVTDKECALLGDAWGPVVDKYFPGALNAGPEASAALVTLAVLGPRLGKPRKPTEAPEADTGQGQTDA